MVRIATLMLCAMPALTWRRDHRGAAALRDGRSRRSACLLGFPPRHRARRGRVAKHPRAFVLGAARIRALLLRHEGRGKPDDDPVIPKETGTYRRSFDLPKAWQRPRDPYRVRSRDDRHHGVHQRQAGRRRAPGRLLSLRLRHHATGEARPQRHRSARHQGVRQQERESRRAPRRLLDLRRHLSACVAGGAAAKSHRRGSPSTRAPMAASARKCISNRPRTLRHARERDVA